MVYATETNSTQVPNIINCLLKLIEKTTPENMPALISGLSEKRMSGDLQGSNALYFMMKALNWSATNNPTEVLTITNCLLNLIEKTTPENMPALINGLSEKSMSGDFQGSNAFYWMMTALNWVAQKNPTQVPTITNCLLNLIEKTPPENMPALISGLSEKRMSGYYQGCNALYFMMNALDWVAKKNPTQVPNITNCLLKLIEKTTPENMPALISGLSEKKMSGEWQGSNAFYWMMNALYWVAKNNLMQTGNIKNDFLVIFVMLFCKSKKIEKTLLEMITSLKKEFFYSLFDILREKSLLPPVAAKEQILAVCFSIKKELSTYLKDYLKDALKHSSQADLKDQCEKGTSLAKLIDYHSDQKKQGGKPTATRLLVQKLCGQNSTGNFVGRFFKRTADNDAQKN